MVQLPDLKEVLNSSKILQMANNNNNNNNNKGVLWTLRSKNSILSSDYFTLQCPHLWPIELK